MPYILGVEAQSIANQNMDSGDDIEVTSGSARKTIQVGSVTRGRATVRWPGIDEYDVDLQTGELKLQILPLTGPYQIDCLTGSVVGTRCVLCPDDLVRVDELRPGDKVRLVDDSTLDEMRADVVDALPSEGILQVFVHARRDWAPGRSRGIGWRVSPTALRALRERAGLVAKAS